jgi:hypothetical protein
MVQHSADPSYVNQQLAKKITHPKRLDLFFHGVKTAKLVKALITDARIPIVRKGLFVGSIAAFFIVLLFPDAINETIMGTVLPFVGLVLGVPVDAGFDWVAFALVGVSLLRFFPKEILSEHYGRIFEK